MRGLLQTLRLPQRGIMVRKIILPAIASAFSVGCYLPTTAHAQDEKCHHALVPAFLAADERSSLRIALMEIIDEQTYKTAREGGKVGISDWFTGDYSKDKASTEKLKKELKFNLNAEQSRSLIYRALTPGQLAAYTECLRTTQHGLHVVAIPKSETTGEATVIWSLMPGTVADGSLVIVVTNGQITDSRIRQTGRGSRVSRLELPTPRAGYNRTFPIFISNSDKDTIIEVFAGKDGGTTRTGYILPKQAISCPAPVAGNWEWKNLPLEHKIVTLGGRYTYPGSKKIAHPLIIRTQNDMEYRNFKIVAHDSLGRVANAVLVISVDGVEFGRKGVSDGNRRGGGFAAIFNVTPVLHEIYRRPDSPSLIGKSVYISSIDAGNSAGTEETVIYGIEYESRVPAVVAPPECDIVAVRRR